MTVTTSRSDVRAVPLAPLDSASDAATVRRQELAAFLRSRRERLRPDDVGLTTYGRRRTPGLRREEVAQLAGVGVTWYTWLEQGRDINVSPQVLEALARTLHFDRHERSHLMALAGAPETTVPSTCPTVTPGVLAVLDALEPSAAVVLNARRDVLAWNGTYGRIFTELEDMEPDERNILQLIFLHPTWRRRMPDFEISAPRLVAQFRSAMAEHLSEPAWKCLLEKLLQSGEFAEYWERHEVLGPETGCKRYVHDDYGLLRLDFTHLWLDQRLGTRMTVYTPADDETRLALEKLSVG